MLMIEWGWRAAVFVVANSYEEKRAQSVVEARQRRTCHTVDDSTNIQYSIP